MGRSSRHEQPGQGRLRLLMLYCAVLLVSGACAQPPAGNRPNRQVVLGLLSLKTAEQEAPYDRLKLDALRELGWAEGVNVRLESRYADGDRQRLADDAQDLVSRGVDAIWAATSAEALAARQATTTIPIVMASAGDPVGTGLVASLREPGGNVTGATANAPSLGGKQLEILSNAFPQVKSVAVLWNEETSIHQRMLASAQDLAEQRAIRLLALSVKGPSTLLQAFDVTTDSGVEGLLVFGGPEITRFRTEIIAFAAERRLPAIYAQRPFVDEGGLMSYGLLQSEVFRRSAVLVDKVLRGTPPAIIPVEQPTRYEFVVNLRTAEALGVTIPRSGLPQPTDVIR